MNDRLPRLKGGGIGKLKTDCQDQKTTSPILKIIQND